VPDSPTARHSASVMRLLSMCQMTVASFRITATRAMLAPSTPLEALEPLPQPGVLAQHLDGHLRQQPSRPAAARLGDAPQPLVVLAAVAAAGGEPPVVGQAVRPREALDPADPARQRDGGEGTHPRH